MFIKFPDFYSIIGLIFSIFKSPEVRISQKFFCKLKLGMFAPRVFDCHVKPKLMSEGVFKSETIRAQSFDTSFGAPECSNWIFATENLESNVSYSNQFNYLFLTFYCLVSIFLVDIAECTSTYYTGKLRKAIYEENLESVVDIITSRYQVRNCQVFLFQEKPKNYLKNDVQIPKLCVSKYLLIIGPNSNYRRSFCLRLSFYHFVGP